MTDQPKKRGGPQPGSGRPPKDTADKFPKVKITMTPEHYAATAGDRSGMVRRALDFAPPKEFDYCMVGRVGRVDFSIDENGRFNRVEVEFFGGALCIIRFLKPPVWLMPDNYVKITCLAGEYSFEKLNQPSGDTTP